MDRKNIFIEKSKKIHGNKYDYSKVEYINNKTHVVLKCNDCSTEFSVRPDNHLHGTNCPTCGAKNRRTTNTLTQEQFIENMKKIHGDSYDYSLVEYVNNSTKVKVFCNNCGNVFEVTPGNHHSGHGCSFCKKSHKKTLDEFKNELLLVNKSLIVIDNDYINKHTPIKVKCSVCNTEFENRPNLLLRGANCPTCYVKNRGKSTKNTLESIIERAVEKHGDNYDYSKVEYVNYHTSICIICPIHGEFWQKPGHHLSGQGCPKCANKYVTTEEFIEKLKLVHGDKYDYSKVEYVNSVKKVCLICPKHGEFWQRPERLLLGNTCPYCKESKLEKSVDKALTKENLTYERQKRFEWLGLQSLDFYLPQYNMAIECQGIQHFEPCKHFGGEERFGIDLKRDINKNKLCVEHGINLIYLANDDAKIDDIIDNQLYENIYTENNLFKINKIKELLNENNN